MIAVNAAMPKLLGLYETHLTVADLKTSTDFYRDVVGLESAASFEERKVASSGWTTGRLACSAFGKPEPDP